MKTKKYKKKAKNKDKDHSEDEEQFHTLLRHLPIGIYRTTLDGRILEANDTLVKMLGYRKNTELKVLNVRDLYFEAGDRDRLLKKLETKSTYSEELKLRRKDGQPIWGRDVSLAILDDSGEVKYYDGIIIDITKQKKAEEDLKRANKKLEEQSITDDLTGLHNRRGFYLVADNHRKLADRDKKQMFLLFMDLDNLKAINDTYGHHKGDEALCVLADILEKSFRKSDVKGRMGGDEFAVFPIGTSRKGVNVAIKRFERNIDEFNADKSNPFELTVSTGLACYDPHHPTSIDELLVRADKLMYEKKRVKIKR